MLASVWRRNEIASAGTRLRWRRGVGTVKGIDPILHLSIPVRDLDEARRFYRGVLGCTIGRANDDFVDAWFFGMQVTLHRRPDQTGGPGGQGVRHFGVTLERDAFDAAVARVNAHDVDWLVEVGTDHAGTPVEQTKGKLADPSGNLIELKTYPHVDEALPRN
jgi:extradiol dioxygenase family protein